MQHQENHFRFLKTISKGIFKKMQRQENHKKNLEDENHKKHRRLFSRVDYIAGENMRDSNGKFKCGLRVDEDFNGDIDFALA